MEQKSTLFNELWKMTFISIGIYILLFAILMIANIFSPYVSITHVDELYPTLPSASNQLLPWVLADGEINWPFIIGIPASILGTAYVLTIRNPHNYLGFYPGILMSLLLAVQFYWNHSYDLMFLYIGVFIPFLIASIVSWKKGEKAEERQQSFTPSFLLGGQACLLFLAFLLIIGIDIYLSSRYIHKDIWTDNLAYKVFSGCSIASSLFANLLMIRKKNDAWIYWIIYCISSIILFGILGNAFSVVMAITMLVVNTAGFVGWIRKTRNYDFGWAEHIQNRIRMLINI